MILGALFTLAAIYALGFIGMVAYLLINHPWRIHPRPVGWQYTRWGLPLALFLEGFVWPLDIVRVVKDAM